MKVGIYMIIFSERLKSVLDEKHITQSELSRETGIKRQNIYQYVNNKSVGSIENLVKISKALNVSTDYLLGLSDHKDIR